MTVGTEFYTNICEIDNNKLRNLKMIVKRLVVLVDMKASKTTWREP